MIEMPRVRFSEFLQPSSRPYTLADDQNADLVGMRWYGEGPFHREHKEAHRIRKKSHFLIKSGDVIFNKLFAWKGAFGIVPPELDGMYVSDKFPTYLLDTHIVNSGYLKWYFRHSELWDQARGKSTGSAAISKLTLNPPQFLDLELPLPGMADQIRISEILNGIDARIRQASALGQEVLAHMQELGASVVSSVFEPFEATGTLEDILLERPRNGWSPKCDNEPDGTPVLTLTAVTGWEYAPAAFKRTSLPTLPEAHYWLKEGDLLITRSNTPELVGHAAIYDGTPEPCIYPDLIMRLKPDEARWSKRFVWWWLQSGAARHHVRTNAKGSSPTMKKISQSVVMGIPFPTDLDLEAQNTIVERLEHLYSDLLSAKTIADSAVLELPPLMPAILDRAFTGQL